MMHSNLKALNLMAETSPHYFSSFYTRGKLINGRIPAAPATLIVDLIKQCSFGCAFCFAGDTENRGRMFNPQQLKELLQNLSGIPKIVLIGGEPFEHPQIGEVLEIVYAAASQEVEIFTNGAAVPVEAQAADAWLAGILGKAPSDKLVLTLAADACHKKIHSPERFENLVETFIRWNDNDVRTRFNVTDGRIYTGDYMDLPAMRAVMNDLSPAILREFEKALAADQLTTRFYLNPLVAQGRQGAEEPGVEYLRPADMLFSPELVLTLNRNGQPEYRAALNAAWMDDPPDYLVLGKADADLMPRIAGEIAARKLGDAAAGMLKAASGEVMLDIESLAAQVVCDDFGIICRNRDEYFWRLAEKLWSIIEKPQPFTWDLSGYYNIDRVGLPVLHLLLDKMSVRGMLDEAFYGRLLNIWQPYIDGGANPPQPCAFFDRHNLGRLPEERGGLIPLKNAGLHSGFGDWPRRFDYTLKPTLLLAPGGDVHYTFDTRIEWLTGDGSEESAAHLLDFMALMLPPAVNAEFRRRLAASASQDSPLPRIMQVSGATDRFSSEVDFFFTDPETLFNYVAFDRNSNELPYNNKTLLQSLLQLDMSDFPRERAEAWRARLQYHLKKLEPEKDRGRDFEIDLSDGDTLERIGRAAEARIERISFKGDELAARADFSDIMRRVVAEGLEFAIESDGVLFSRHSIAERMQRFGLRHARIRLYGGTRFAHQLVKGADDFYKALDGIRNLIDCGVNVSVLLKVCAHNRGTLKTAAVELLKCGLYCDKVLEFEDTPQATFASEIKEASRYAHDLCNRTSYSHCVLNWPLSGAMITEGQTIEFDPQYCSLKSKYDAGEEPLPYYSLLLCRKPGLYEIHYLNIFSEEQYEELDAGDVIYTKNIRRLVFLRRGNKRYRLELEPACAACRHLTRCPAAFHVSEKKVKAFKPFDGAYKPVNVCARETRLAQLFAIMKPGERIAVGGRFRHFVLDDTAWFDCRPFAGLALLCDLAYAHGLVAVDYALPEESGSERFAILYEKPLKPVERVERMAVANISSACIANCIMCSMPQVFRGHTIGTISACAMLEELKICGFQMVDTFGGEISLRGDLLTLIRTVKHLNMISNIISTGYRLDETYVSSLIDAGLDKVQISIDSPEADMHDRIRGTEGLFEHACEAVRRFRESGKVFLEVNSVILPENIRQIKRLHHFVVKTLGVVHHRLFYCVQIPTALTEPHHLSTEQARWYFNEEYPEILKLSSELSSSIDFCPPVRPGDYPDSAAMYEAVSRGHYNNLSPCEAPQRDLFITPEGEIYPCVNPSIISRIKPLGRLGEIKIIDALRSEAMNEARRMAGLWPECASCISKR